MKTDSPVPHKDLPEADLVIDAVYEGAGTQLSGEPISKLLKVGTAGGFRDLGRGENKKLVVLYTSGKNRDWPDELDVNTGRFIYYGDNRQPGRELHATNGNRVLRFIPSPSSETVIIGSSSVLRSRRTMTSFASAS